MTTKIMVHSCQEGSGMANLVWHGLIMRLRTFGTVFLSLGFQIVIGLFFVGDLESIRENQKSGND